MLMTRSLEMTVSVGLLLGQLRAGRKDDRRFRDLALVRQFLISKQGCRISRELFQTSRTDAPLFRCIFLDDDSAEFCLHLLPRQGTS